ncbi:hypothetical protein COLO4_13603 [Corchorus olitorius]|uniref:Uncharacterized protein n=1 Tax=Corchorus olitorius TaxID=93759 RepID=A0A1R3JW95_9ROSI|nr:hypothetical protein COLO4_13603 [Corchorus olitorius]
MATKRHVLPDPILTFRRNRVLLVRVRQNPPGKLFSLTIFSM